MTETLDQTLTAYHTWLDRQPLATKTRIAYRLQVHQACQCDSDGKVLCTI